MTAEATSVCGAGLEDDCDCLACRLRRGLEAKAAAPDRGQEEIATLLKALFARNGGRRG